jgi:hypothetical protein
VGAIGMKMKIKTKFVERSLRFEGRLSMKQRAAHDRKQQHRSSFVSLSTTLL